MRQISFTSLRPYLRRQIVVEVFVLLSIVEALSRRAYGSPWRRYCVLPTRQLPALSCCLARGFGVPSVATGPASDICARRARQSHSPASHCAPSLSSMAMSGSLTSRRLKREPDALAGFIVDVGVCLPPFCDLASARAIKPRWRASSWRQKYRTNLTPPSTHEREFAYAVQFRRHRPEKVTQPRPFRRRAHAAPAHVLFALDQQALCIS